MKFQDVVNGKGEIRTIGSTAYTIKETVPAINCADGTTLSVQASKTHYCKPRDDYGPYTHVEVGFPSVRPLDSWEQYFDGEWQLVGFLGSIERIWKNRGSVWYAFKQAMKTKRWWYFLCLTTLSDNATNSVYGYVPVELVREFIDLHGGECEPGCDNHPAQS